MDIFGQLSTATTHLVSSGPGMKTKNPYIYGTNLGEEAASEDRNRENSPRCLQDNGAQHGVFTVCRLAAAITLLLYSPRNNGSGSDETSAPR